MKRVFSVVIFATILLLTVPGIALAQGSGSPDTVEPFPLKFFAWLVTEPPDWFSGVLFAVSGFFGALATAYTLLGSVMPDTSGQARIDESTARLKRFSERLDKLITPDTGSQDVPADTIRAVGERVENLTDDLSRELWKQYIISIILYALLGAFFATALAQDVLQALLIGAGWTGLLGTLGLNRKATATGTATTAALDRAESHLTQAQARIPLAAQGTQKDVGESIVSAKEEIGLAKDIAAPR